MRRLLVAALLGLAIVSTAKADIVLGTGENLSWNAATDPSPTFTISVSGPDRVLAWSLGLAISRVSGTGTVNFAVPPLTGSPPTAPLPPPPNYLFAADSSGILSVQPQPQPPVPPVTIQLFANDAATDSGVVPSSGANNLLAFTFSATAGTAGVFEIDAYGHSAQGSYWLDSNANLFAFGNAPFASDDPTSGHFGPALSLGTVTVTQNSAVPEPHSALLLLCGGGGALLLYCRVRRRTTGLAA